MWRQHRLLKSMGPCPDRTEIWQAWRHFASFKASVRALQKTSRLARRQHIEELIILAEKASQQPNQSEVYRVINQLAPKKRVEKVRIRTQDGELLGQKQEFQAIYEYFSGAFSRTTDYQRPSLEALNITASVVDVAISQLKSIPARDDAWHLVCSSQCYGPTRSSHLQHPHAGCLSAMLIFLTSLRPCSLRLWLLYTAEDMLCSFGPDASTRGRLDEELRINEGGFVWLRGASIKLFGHTYHGYGHLLSLVERLPDELNVARGKACLPLLSEKLELPLTFQQLHLFRFPVFNDSPHMRAMQELFPEGALTMEVLTSLEAVLPDELRRDLLANNPPDQAALHRMKAWLLGTIELYHAATRVSWALHRADLSDEVPRANVPDIYLEVFLHIGNFCLAAATLEDVQAIVDDSMSDVLKIEDRVALTESVHKWCALHQGTVERTVREIGQNVRRGPYIRRGPSVTAADLYEGLLASDPVLGLAALEKKLKLRKAGTGARVEAEDLCRRKFPAIAVDPGSHQQAVAEPPKDQPAPSPEDADAPYFVVVSRSGHRRLHMSRTCAVRQERCLETIPLYSITQDSADAICKLCRPRLKEQGAVSSESASSDAVEP
ncbi:unnamed protein product [Symbiodinium sp. CCMP2592]|nr:unnamed protein product [Symbiodinium sp. CCMP2592]